MDLSDSQVEPSIIDLQDSTPSTIDLTRKQKLALRWHDGQKGLNLDSDQLHFLFERFSESYSLSDRHHLLSMLDTRKRTKGSREALLGIS